MVYCQPLTTLRLYAVITPTVMGSVGPSALSARYSNEPRYAAAYLGSLEYRAESADGPTEPMTVGVMTAYKRNVVSGWQYTIDQLSLFFERALAIGPEDVRARDILNVSPWTENTLPPIMVELTGGYFESARRLAQRTAELHQAL